jgi:hypothetical protein
LLVRRGLSPTPGSILWISLSRKTRWSICLCSSLSGPSFSIRLNHMFASSTRKWVPINYGCSVNKHSTITWLCERMSFLWTSRRAKDVLRTCVTLDPWLISDTQPWIP